VYTAVTRQLAKNLQRCS